MYDKTSFKKPNFQLEITSQKQLPKVNDQIKQNGLSKINDRNDTILYQRRPNMDQYKKTQNNSILKDAARELIMAGIDYFINVGVIFLDNLISDNSTKTYNMSYKNHNLTNIKLRIKLEGNDRALSKELNYFKNKIHIDYNYVKNYDNKHTLQYKVYCNNREYLCLLLSEYPNTATIIDYENKSLPYIIRDTNFARFLLERYRYSIGDNYFTYNLNNRFC
ncbi:hypothetical protein R4K52_08230 [Brachyspira pilosicoli]|uniref:hypothetical protein n=1 Tax=Brachyspira pilosicoli TaxID=52584 RepID=UPI003006F935